MGMGQQGHVFLVGAGPGDPGLLTLKGDDALRRADVVIYDHLVSPRLLERCRPGARRVYVGKAADDHCTQQSLINRLLVREAKRGQQVVRLKGGDPFVFGRGAEEVNQQVLDVIGEVADNDTFHNRKDCHRRSSNHRCDDSSQNRKEDIDRIPESVENSVL